VEHGGGAPAVDCDRHVAVAVLVEDHVPRPGVGETCARRRRSTARPRARARRASPEPGRRARPPRGEVEGDVAANCRLEHHRVDTGRPRSGAAGDRAGRVRPDRAAAQLGERHAVREMRARPARRDPGRGTSARCVRARTRGSRAPTSAIPPARPPADRSPLSGPTKRCPSGRRGRRAPHAPTPGRRPARCTPTACTGACSRARGRPAARPSAGMPCVTSITRASGAILRDHAVARADEVVLETEVAQEADDHAARVYDARRTLDRLDEAVEVARPPRRRRRAPPRGPRASSPGRSRRRHGRVDAPVRARRDGERGRRGRTPASSAASARPCGRARRRRRRACPSRSGARPPPARTGRGRGRRKRLEEALLRRRRPRRVDAAEGLCGGPPDRGDRGRVPRMRRRSSRAPVTLVSTTQSYRRRPRVVAERLERDERHVDGSWPRSRRRPDEPPSRPVGRVTDDARHGSRRGWRWLTIPNPHPPTGNERYGDARRRVCADLRRSCRRVTAALAHGSEPLHGRSSCERRELAAERAGPRPSVARASCRPPRRRAPSACRRGTRRPGRGTAADRRDARALRLDRRACLRSSVAATSSSSPARTWSASAPCPPRGASRRVEAQPISAREPERSSPQAARTTHRARARRAFEPRVDVPAERLDDSVGSSASSCARRRPTRADPHPRADLRAPAEASRGSSARGYAPTASPSASVEVMSFAECTATSMRPRGAPPRAP
jgi:hypothetical protein